MFYNATLPGVKLHVLRSNYDSCPSEWQESSKGVSVALPPSVPLSKLAHTYMPFDVVFADGSST